MIIKKKDIEKLLKENEYYEVYNLAIKYIEIKMRSKSEIIKYLEKKNFDGNAINAVVEKLEEIGLLDDLKYIKDFSKFKSEYNEVRLIKTSLFHDRFIIIDKKDLYHLGSSLNSIGDKCFCVNKINDMYLLEKLLYKIKSIYSRRL